MSKETLDHLRSQKKPVRKTLWLCFESEVVEQQQKLRAEADALHKRAAGVQGPGFEAMLDRAEMAELAYEKFVDDVVKPASMKFVFQSIGRAKWDKLIEDHPSTEEQKEDIKKDLEEAAETGMAAVGAGSIAWNLETFPPALIAACMVEPEGLTTEEKLEWLNDDTWNQMELTEMFQVCIEVNMSSKVAKMGKGSRRTLTSH